MTYDEWLTAFSDEAARQGWGLFECSGSDRDPIELQRIDCQDVTSYDQLTDDIYAWLLVARQDTPAAIEALAVLRAEGCTTEVAYIEETMAGVWS